MARRVGAGTIRLERAAAIAAVAAVGSRLEQEGPLGVEFDRTVEDSSFGEKSWEKAETKMQQLAMELALQKGQTAPEQVDVVLATIDQKDADLEYRPVKMCEFVMAVGKNHHLATLAVAKEGFQYPWVDLKACEKEENVMLLPGSPFRQHADEIYGHYHLKPNVVYQISGTRTGLSCVAYHEAIMITLDHMIFNNPFSKEIVPLSIGDAPIQIEIDLIYMKDTVLKTEMEKLYEIICEAIR